MPRTENYPINAFIDRLAGTLKEQKLVTPTAWAAYAKTGNHKERPPVDNDWWYTRSAAVLRTVALQGPVGVSKLRAKYGGKKNRGHKPSVFVKGSGNIARKILQQLEHSGLVAQVERGTHKGRALTKKGTALIQETAKAFA